MPTTGLFFVPETASGNALSSFVDRLCKLYQPVPGERWSLEHRLMREVGARAGPGQDGSADPGAGPAPLQATNGKEERQERRQLQILHLSHVPESSFVCVAGNASPPTMIAIPHPAGDDQLSQLLQGKLGPLWVSRQTTQVSNGVAYVLGEYRVRAGEIRQGHGVQSVKGMIVEVEWPCGLNSDYVTKDTTAQDDQLWATGEQAIRTLWETLGMGADVKTFMHVKGDDKVLAALKRPLQYCELLRSRS